MQSVAASVPILARLVLFVWKDNSVMLNSVRLIPFGFLVAVGLGVCVTATSDTG